MMIDNRENQQPIKKENRFRRKNIDYLLKQYTIEDIECTLVETFLEKNNIKNLKNSFIKKLIKNSETTQKIKSYFTKNEFTIDLKNIEKAFELLIPIKDRSVNGAFYTPNLIVDYIVDKTISSNNKVCDPSCGSGAFLVSATRKLSKITKKKIVSIIENNIAGCDILDYNIRRTKILLTLLALENGEDTEFIGFNLACGDSLTLHWANNFSKFFKTVENSTSDNQESCFDVVIGNPPYIRIQDLNQNLRNSLLKWNTTGGGNFNIYFAFFELGLKLLTKEGKLGYIVPNNYFTSFAAEKLRLWMQTNNLIEEIIDFTHLRIFEDATTYTCITILQRSDRSDFNYDYVDNYNALEDLQNRKPDKIKFSILDSKKWRLLKKADYENIKKIESIGTPLGKISQINSGIATLKDNLYFVKTNTDENGYYKKSFNGVTYIIPKEITKKIIKISDIKNENDIQTNQLRIIFPYMHIGGEFKIIPENTLKFEFPECYKYFLAIKNELSKRDKGKKTYPIWYAYGRGQGFEIIGKKLLTPTFSKKPKFMLDNEGDSLFCNGYAISNSKINLKVLKKILNSKIMAYYITKTSVRIAGDFPCFQKNFIEKFTIPEFTNDEENFLKNETNTDKIDTFLISKYELTMH